jgi:hypothetical protein
MNETPIEEEKILFRTRDKVEILLYLLQDKFPVEDIKKIVEETRECSELKVHSEDSSKAAFAARMWAGDLTDE